LIIEGATEKVFQFVIQLKPIYNKKICSDEKNVFLNTSGRLKHGILKGEVSKYQ
jgi:hypothetical protein